MLNVVFVWESKSKLSGFYVMQDTAFAVAIVLIKVLHEEEVS